MFSWKKQNPPSQQRQQRQAPGDYSDLISQGMRLANEDIGHDEDDAMGEDLDEDLGDIDLDDPELLAELQGLTGEAPPPRPKPAASQPPAKVLPPAPTSASQAQKLAPASSAPQQAGSKQTPSTTQPPAQFQTKSASSPAPALPAALAGLGLDLHGVMEDDDDEEVELTEDDWNDPHLLAQLQSFGGHTDHRAPTSTATPEAIAGSSLTSESQPRVIPTISPPTQSTSIPAESSPLSAAGSQPSTERRPVSASSSMIAIPPRDRAFGEEDVDEDSVMTDNQQDMPIVAEEPLTSDKPSKRLEETPKKNSKDLLQLLQTRDVQYKRAALDAKRAGDMALAAERVKTFKSLQTWIRLVEAGGFLDLELYPVPDEPPAATTITSTVAQPTTPLLTGTESTAVPPPPQRLQADSAIAKTYAPPIASSAPEATTQISSSIAEASAEDMRGGSTIRGAVRGKIEFKQLAADDDFQIVSNSDNDTYDMLESQLKSQIEMCKTTCAYYFQVGHKQTALEFHKLNKVFKTDLVSLQSCRNHGKKVPAFHFQDVRFELEVGFYQEIGVNDLSLSVVRAWDLSHKDVQPTDIEAYVSWDLGWPTENMAGTGAGRGTTPTVKRTIKPEFNYSKTLSIERTRAFQRFVERRKATFELLDPGTRRNTGGKVEIKIRLQRPLLKPEIVVKEEKWLVIDEFNSGGLGFPTPVAAVAPPARAAASPVTSRTATPATKSTKLAGTPAVSVAPAASVAPASRASPLAAVTRTTGPAQVAPSQVKQAVVTSGSPSPAPSARGSQAAAASPKVPVSVVKATNPAPAASVEDSEETESEKALSELNSVELIASNMVLESEIQHAQQMVHDARAVGNSDAADEHQDRLTQLEIKMKLLVIQVQTGQLTMDGYCQAVNARIAKDKKLAIEFKRLGMLPEAKRALGRSKIMAQEMKEVEEAMAAQAAEGE
ncbi:Coiled-coil and C2 domain-containing protein 1B [Dissophora globulifera]|uniref:Coiled-coil and C2 domain-containing protein 1B n=1 Tax=Dissophora globulifera TaxID=979702 RepID=A0A9P6UZU6_9FUNG|nr:Coiled-coil and C2 domain-containing protein 1B [Dissophora globulifera]